MELKHVGMFQRWSSRGLAWPSSPPLLGHGIYSDGTTVVSAAFFCLLELRTQRFHFCQLNVACAAASGGSDHTTLVGWTAKKYFDDRG